jgi:glyoxalase/bleomycin resistance protein/dioxygenase superfamily protein
MAIKGARPNEARVAPHLLVSDGERAIAFYAAAFDATVLYQSPMPGGHGVHAQIRIAESTLLITTVGASAGSAHPSVGSPESLGVRPPFWSCTLMTWIPRTSALWTPAPHP